MATRTEMVYGRSGSGKTTWWLRLAEEFFVRHGKRTRLYIGDGGAETVESSGFVDEGIVEMLQFNLRDNPIETSQRVCEGWWPNTSDLKDPKAPLQPPKYADLDGKFGLFVFEGLSVMADFMMGDKPGGLAEQASRGNKIGMDSPYVVVDGTTKFGGNPPTHFGFAQRRILDCIERTRALPGWVYWTAHERKAEDNETGEKEFGPDIAGKALTTKIGASFGNSIHLHPAAKKVKVKDKVTGKEVEHLEVEYRAYTRKHYDPEGNTFVRYFANNRMPRGFEKDMPEYLAPPDPIAFYSILEEAKRKKLELLRGRDGQGNPINN